MSDNFEVIKIDDRVAAMITTDSRQIFEQENIKPVPIEKITKIGYVPYGDDNTMPNEIREKVYASDVMAPNVLFNILTNYGQGLSYDITEDATDQQKAEIKRFFLRNNPIKYLWEQNTDLETYSYCVSVIVLNGKGDKIVRLVPKEGYHCRFETVNKDTNKIEHVFFADWANNPTKENIEAVELLDPDDTWFDLRVRLGIEPDEKTGKKRTPTKTRKFALLIRIPTPGNTYYPVPYYHSSFKSGWYDISTYIPVAKKALMNNGMKIKYQVEINNKYWDYLFENENITDPEKKKARRKLEYTNITNFITGEEKAGKVWFSAFYVDPTGKEQSMVRVILVDSSKSGGDWIEDAEEASNFICYAQGVHPGLNGATPGKASGTLQGSDKRETFTMKQALAKPKRDLLLQNYLIISDFNKWPEKMEYLIKDIMLTTLDKGTDATTAAPVNVQPTSKPTK